MEDWWSNCGINDDGRSVGGRSWHRREENSINEESHRWSKNTVGCHLPTVLDEYSICCFNFSNHQFSIQPRDDWQRLCSTDSHWWTIALPGKTSPWCLQLAPSQPYLPTVLLLEKHFKQKAFAILLRTYLEIGKNNSRTSYFPVPRQNSNVTAFTMISFIRMRKLCFDEDWWGSLSLEVLPTTSSWSSSLRNLLRLGSKEVTAIPSSAASKVWSCSLVSSVFVCCIGPPWGTICQAHQQWQKKLVERDFMRSVYVFFEDRPLLGYSRGQFTDVDVDFCNKQDASLYRYDKFVIIL